ncbi:hypothetical protein, partial [Brevibacillus sp. SAFN-007a]|uniref:hypothetical protein n=1 Tax=Brevibacillus sp. SAFN-007a TaxID=3436862 RepID=UPI003F7FA70E
AASVRPEPGSNSPIKFVAGSSWQIISNDRLINAFAVQFSKSILPSLAISTLWRRPFKLYHVFSFKSRVIF